MVEYRVVALSREIADEVRRSSRAPGYGHPAHVELANGYGPCRLCLRTFRQGEEERVLFTYNPFPKDAALPSPGPVFVHKDACPRFDGPNFPPGLRGLPMTLEAYDATGAALLRVGVSDDPEACVQEALAPPQVAYVHIRNTEAGCFIGRIERVAQRP
jgi:hypothetical protein